MFIIAFLVIVALIVYLFLQHPKFGKYATGSSLNRIKNSPNYSDGKFQNLSYTPDLTEGTTYFKVLKKVLLEKNKRSRPSQKLPSQKTDLFALQPHENIIVWFGHSSYFIQTEGKKILVDPVFSGAASPVPVTTRSFEGSDIYTVDDIPALDYLIITHDHWDHLDYKTVLALKPKVKTVLTGLGTAAHLEYWGYKKEIIIENDWNETVDLGDGFTLNTVPARHFSGRGLKRNQAIWLSFVLKTPERNLFLGGDSGYDTHFAAIGKQFGPFDLAILECGQYDESWRYIHLLPEEILQAAIDLKSKILMPVHWGKFALGNHDWDTPIKAITALAKDAGLPLLTPYIGQKVNLDQTGTFEPWWLSID